MHACILSSHRRQRGGAARRGAAVAGVAGGRRRAALRQRGGADIEMQHDLLRLAVEARIVIRERPLQRRAEDKPA